jgi:hypothetical protein
LAVLSAVRGPGASPEVVVRTIQYDNFDVLIEGGAVTRTGLGW